MPPDKANGGQSTETSRTDSLCPLADSEFGQIRDLARRTFGLDLREGKQDLVAARLQRLLRQGGFRSYRDYYRHVMADTTGEALMALIDALATNHTAFFREADHFEFLRRVVLPELLSKRSLDVWSAACSTGEEVWTLIFLLREAMPNAKVRVIGTDISRKALQVAARAVYASDRIGTLPHVWQESGFVKNEPSPGSYLVKPAMRSCAVFRRLNLLDPVAWSIKFPIIFCRNVMIYFDQLTQAKVITNLSAHLEPGGYLFVGHAESFSGIRHGLEYVRPAIYRKSAAKQGGSWRAL
jgi:chemotaxis protein methyltransferase CheR